MFLNRDSGIALFDSDRATVQGNLVLSNSNAGMRLSQGCTDNLVANNQVAFSGTNGFYFFMARIRLSLIQSIPRFPVGTGATAFSTTWSTIVEPMRSK